MKPKHFFKYISFILIFAILFTSMPINSFAEVSTNTKSPEDLSALFESGTVPEADIIGEIPEKRDRSTKYFLEVFS